MKHRYATAVLAGLWAIATPAVYGLTETTNTLKLNLPQAPSGGFAGTVLETVDAGRYTYVLVNTGKEKLWAAAPQFPVGVGDQVKVSAGISMHDFPSKTLNRTFETVFFADRIAVTDAAPGARKGLTEAAADANSRTLVPPSAQLDFTGLKKPAGGRTVAEVYAQKAKLANQPVIVRGKVVKYSAKIMKKNWLHLQDGTGTPGANDLTVTTEDTVKVGDTVLVKGTLVLDKDFGYGYKYAALLGNSQVTVETAWAPRAQK